MSNNEDNPFNVLSSAFGVRNSLLIIHLILLFIYIAQLVFELIIYRKYWPNKLRRSAEPMGFEM
jgi:thiosulfate reductase cytochrome b subunit